MSKVLSALGGALPDERPLLSLQIVEAAAKCPKGYWPVSRTHDEDADAGLLRQNAFFGKKFSHYICLSKSEGVPGYVMDGVVVVNEGEAAPAGFSVAGRVGKRRLCTRVSRPAAAQPRPPVTDVIVCSKMRHAPTGFLLAGEINGKVVCYKVSGGSAETSPTHKQSDYENVPHITPEANKRLRPAEYPKLVSEMNALNLAAPEFASDHDYEALSLAYNIKPSRPAPRPPSAVSPVVGSPVSPAGGARARQAAALPRAALYQTLGGYSPLDGVPFLLNPKLRGLPADHLTQLPAVTRRTRFDLDRDYSYNFSVERQT